MVGIVLDPVNVFSTDLYKPLWPLVNRSPKAARRIN
jgi:hypothetical protein